ncbi:MAG TPA: hypothetical protein VFZ09_14615 [Archangium sp.]|uniref:hypothetical protein n=1 Tax=Archangium sp. TaxID=1872627 RepID=UPI002E34C7F8|nr:hypothetical protein [Archangium sp.]HEX5747475.1 hypothetical protein [Archangium sp.]
MNPCLRRCVLTLSMMAAGLSGCQPREPSGQPDAGQPGPTCSTPTGAPIEHQGTISAPETWSASNPHVVVGDLLVRAAVTVEPCAVVRMGPARSIGLDSGGSLVAAGTQERPVRFEPQDASQPWGQFRIYTGGSARLTWTVLSGGGNPASAEATVRVSAGADLPGPRPLFVDHVTIEGSRGPGVVLNGTSGFAEGSTALVIRDSGSEARPEPLAINPNALGTLPSGTYTGNRSDTLFVSPGVASSSVFYVGVDATVRALGVPYVLEGLQVGSSSAQATVTVEPGVELRFQPNTTLRVYDNRSALIAVGTASRPVVFTSARATPAAGDWAGIRFDGLSPDSRLESVWVRHAGGACQCSGYGCNYLPGSFDVSSAILVFQQPGAPFIANSRIEDSAGHGILRGWNGSDAVDFLATNSFARVSGCTQTTPRDVEGRCPASPPCPRSP